MSDIPEDKKIKIETLIDNITDHNDRKHSLEDSIYLNKHALLLLMQDLKIDEYVGLSGKAKIIEFDRGNLIKDKVLETFEEINSNLVDEVDVDKHLKLSKVKFVLVKSE